MCLEIVLLLLLKLSNDLVHYSTSYNVLCASRWNRLDNANGTNGCNVYSWITHREGYLNVNSLTVLEDICHLSENIFSIGSVLRRGLGKVLFLSSISSSK